MHILIMYLDSCHNLVLETRNHVDRAMCCHVFDYINKRNSLNSRKNILLCVAGDRLGVAAADVRGAGAPVAAVQLQCLPEQPLLAGRPGPRLRPRRACTCMPKLRRGKPRGVGTPCLSCCSVRQARGITWMQIHMIEQTHKT